MSLQISVLTSLDELEARRRHWELLYAQSDASPYLCLDWILTLGRHRGAPFRVALVDDEDGPLAIVPLQLKSRRLGPMNAAVLHLVGDGWPPRNGAIFHPRADQPAVIRTVLDATWRRGPTWLFCCLRRLPVDSALITDEHHCPPGWKTRRVPVGASVVIELPTDWAAYRSSLSTAHRKNISRRSNGLRRRFDVKVVRVGLDPTDQVPLGEVIEDALTVSRSSWQGSASEGVAISDPRYCGFFADVCRSLAARGMLDLSVLYVDSRPISFIWGAARWPTTTIAKLGFDPQFASLSPGLVHLAEHISDSITRGGSAIDFGHQYTSYKRMWGEPSDQLFDVYYYRNSLRSAVAIWWQNREVTRQVHG